MKKLISLIGGLTFMLLASAQAQTGSIELSSGGFSFVPAFTSKEPNIIINAGTNAQRRLSGNIMYMMRVRSLTPTGIVLISRYKLIDKKFKATIGIHLPAMQMTDKYEVKSLFGQELTLSYPVSKEVTLGSFILNGKGRNTDFKALFMSMFANYHHEKWNALTQVYYLDLDHITGVTETLTYDINKHVQLKGLVNYTITNKDFISTAGVCFNL